MRKYHTLLIREENTWTIDFGSYDKSDVEAERDEHADKGTRKKDMRIITTGAKQQDIQAEVDRINAAWRTET